MTVMNTSITSMNGKRVMSEALKDAEAVTQSRQFKVVRPRLDRLAGNTEQKPVRQSNTAQIAGFGPMSRITTSFGEVYAQTLREGDRVRTKEGHFARIQAIKRMTLDADYLKYHPEAQPVIIRAGAFGFGLPAADVTLAPHQRIHLDQRLPGGRLECAIEAVGRPQVYRRPEQIITYTVFHCGRPTVVNCEGILIDTAP